MSTQFGIFKKVVEFRPRCHQFVRNGEILRGIVTPIKQAFYPNWDFKNCTKGPAHSTDDVDRRSLARSADHGLNKGKLVDKQISKAFVIMEKQGLSLSQFIALRKLPNARRSPGHAAAIHLSKTLLSNTRALFASWAARGLKLVACQLPVGDCAKRLGTSIDVVLLCKDGSYILVNVKTHAFKSYDKHTGTNLAAPFGDIVDSIRNQNQLQLLCEIVLFHKTYAGHKVAAEIQCIDGSHVVRNYELEKWAIKGQNEFWDKL